VNDGTGEAKMGKESSAAAQTVGGSAVERQWYNPSNPLQANRDSPLNLSRAA
jgi:hypothetical protein